MSKYTMRPQRRKPFRLVERQPDLFDWADERAALDNMTMPHAARVIARRFALSPQTARVIAEAAGFAMEAAYG